MKKLKGTKSSLSIGMVSLFAILTILNSCQKSKDDTGPGTNEVFIQGSAFNPSTITVTANSTITWTNKDAAAHTVTSNTGLFSSPTLGRNETFPYTFTIAGSYSYHCTLHPSMTATVKVN
jgi:plastocyanin